MISGNKVVVVMPAYNAERTLERTWREVGNYDFVDLVIVVNDASQDRTASSIDFRHCVADGIGCLETALAFRLSRWRITRSARFPRERWRLGSRVAAVTAAEPS